LPVVILGGRIYADVTGVYQVNRLATATHMKLAIGVAEALEVELRDRVMPLRLRHARSNIVVSFERLSDGITGLSLARGTPLSRRIFAIIVTDRSCAPCAATTLFRPFASL